MYKFNKNYIKLWIDKRKVWDYNSLQIGNRVFTAFLCPKLYESKRTVPRRFIEKGENVWIPGMH